MTYITYMTYIDHSYICCVGCKNTHYIKSHFSKTYEKLIKYFSLLLFLKSFFICICVCIYIYKSFKDFGF